GPVPSRERESPPAPATRPRRVAPGGRMVPTVPVRRPVRVLTAAVPVRVPAVAAVPVAPGPVAPVRDTQRVPGVRRRPPAARTTAGARNQAGVEAGATPVGSYWH